MMINRFLVKLHYLRDVARSPQPTDREPVTMGLPCPRGQLFEPVHMAIDEGPTGRVPVQSRALDHWSDGSIRWVLLDWLGSPAVDAADLIVMSSGDESRADGGRGNRVHSTPNRGVVVDTGAVCVEFGEGPGRVFQSGGWLDPKLLVKDQDGVVLAPHRQAVEVEEVGPIRTTVLVQWDLSARDGECVARVRARCHLFVGLATVRLEVTIHNPRAAGHPGGIWTLGSEGTLLLEEVTLAMPLDGRVPAGRVRYSSDVGRDEEELAIPFSLRQVSSGGVNWDSRNHMNADGEVTLACRGFQLSSSAGQSQGRRATPMVSLETTEGTVGCTMQYFWQDFPKSIEVSDEGLELGLMPRRHGDLHEIQGGERKTHSLVLKLSGGADSPSESFEWGRAPLVVRAEPDWYQESQPVPFLVPAAEDANDRYKALVARSLDAEEGFVAKREIVDEYGWRHFGDLYGDHESAFDESREIFLSHYNNQYDAVAGFATQFFRHGAVEWYLLMDELARHVVDIDVYHTTEDKSTYNGGQFWHTIHYIDAGASTHRAYPPADGVNGGGPSTGNLYTHGLLLHYYLTGSHLSREAVLSLGQYVIDADDGRQTIFRFLDRGYTGHVSESGFDEYHGPGRSPANAIAALLDANRLSGESRFLEKAEQLIRRCIHPHDDVEARGLSDAEHRWFYTMFLQTLGKYLLLKSERGQLDFMYHYASESLLSYAGWAMDNERPYLERPEGLEFPTETWAAQDMRKCEMLNLASLFAAPSEAAGMRERARYFFDRSVEQLEEMRTSTYCRPLVLLLSNGVSQAYFDGQIEELPVREPATPFDFGVAERFETQKRRAVRRAKILVSLTALVSVSVLILWVISM